MSKKLLFIVNPLSGKGNLKNHILNIIDIFVKSGWNVSVHTTQAQNDAFECVKKNGIKFKMVVVAGGDGTLNESIQGLMTIKPEKRPLLGYIPAGTTNDFASNMKISKNPKKAAMDIMKGSLFSCDIGKFNDKNFIYVAAFGAFTDVAYETPQLNKNILGNIAYLLEGAKKLPNLKPYNMKVIYSDGTIEGDFIYGMVSNTNYLGGIKAEKAFRASLDDGLFEVVLVKNPKNVLEAQVLINNLVTQNLSADNFIMFKTDKVCFKSDDAVQWTLDGEFGGSVTETEIVNEKRAVTLSLGEKMSD